MAFSQRMDLKPTKSILQLNSMDDDLRNSLWSSIYVMALERIDRNYDYGESFSRAFVRRLWFAYFKIPIDQAPPRSVYVIDHLKKYFFSCTWNEVYDFVEMVTDLISEWPESSQFCDLCNEVLAAELSGYRLLEGRIVAVTNEQELDAIQFATATSPNSVKAHLTTAIDHFSKRDNPDYRNSIKESISAVESTCKLILGNDSATLGEALKVIEKTGKLDIHPALVKSLEKLYGYTSDEGGIRHAMIDEPNVSSEDARFMLVSCSAFVNYLMEKAHKAGINLNRK